MDRQYLLVATILGSVLVVVIWSCVEAALSFSRNRRERVAQLHAEAIVASVEENLRQLISQRFNCSEDELSQIRTCIKESCLVVDPAGIIELDDYTIARLDFCAAELGLHPTAGAPSSLYEQERSET